MRPPSIRDAGISAALLLATLLSGVLAYAPLSDASLAALAPPGADFNIKTGALLAPILKVRVPGTPAIEQVRQHFVDFFRASLPLWTISFQNSTQDTALGKRIQFVNIIATRDPPGAQTGEVGRLALVAHYDSKLTPEGFVGATDSAAPCAMLLHAARGIDAALTKKWESNKNSGLEEDRGVQIILLDGEESFISWTDADSLYGARSLAAEWEQTIHPARSIYQNDISSINLFVLLDLLGAPEPNVPSYFVPTHWSYKNMATVEGKLRRLGKLKSSPNHPSKRQGAASQNEPKFLPDLHKNEDDVNAFMGGMIEDDHIPFMKRGVEVLHIIPTPFPVVWHTPEDDGEHLDIDTVEDWAVIVTAFAAEWMELEGYMPKSTSPKGKSLPGRSEGFLQERDREDLDADRDEL